MVLLDNPPPCLPNFRAKIAKVCSDWTMCDLTKELGQDKQVKYLLKVIQDLKVEGILGEIIVWSFMSRGVQPIKQQAKTGWTYLKGDIT